jgi:hypothetical protein
MAAAPTRGKAAKAHKNAAALITPSAACGARASTAFRRGWLAGLNMARRVP